MDVATSSTPQRGVSYALACEERGRQVSPRRLDATQLSNGCAHTSAEMMRANGRSTTAEPGGSQEWNWKPKSMER